MSWLLAITLILLLDYLHFKLRYTRRNGPPTLYTPAVIGLLPGLLFPRIFRWCYRRYLRQTPNVCLTRIIGPWLLVKGDALRELQLNDSCQSRPSIRYFDLFGSFMANKKHWFYFDGGHREDTSDYRVYRKLSVAALYTLSRREIEAKVVDTADKLLAQIAKQEGRDWNIVNDLKVTKVQEALYVTIGETLDNDDLLQLAPIMQHHLDYIPFIAFAAELLPEALIRKIFTYLPNQYNIELFFRVYNRVIGKLLARRRVPQGRTEAKDFIEAVLHVRSTDETYEFLCEVVIFILLAGTHTSVTTIVMLLNLLAAYPQYQQRIVAEIVSVIGTGQPSIEYYEQMHFTKAFITERFRIAPPVVFIFRKATTPTTLSGYKIPSGMNIMGILHSENWNPDHFVDPEVFRPERHLDDGGRFVKNPFVDVFSLGRRSCFGKDLAIISNFIYLVKILQNFEVCLPEGQSVKVPKFSGSISQEVPSQKLRFVRRTNAPSIRDVQLPAGLSSLITECLNEINTAL